MSLTETDTRDLTTLTLDELSEAAKVEVEATRFEVEAAHDRLSVALTRYIRLGEILQVARGSTSNWTQWCNDANVTRSVAQQALRLARYKAQLPERPLTVTAALRYLGGLPEANPPGTPLIDDDVIREARALVDAGVSIRGAARMLGMSDTAVHRRLNPARSREVQRRQKERRAKRRREASAAAKALAEKQEREQRDRLAKATGGELSKSYSLVRQALAALAKVGGEQAGRAISDLHRAEESIVKAMQEERAA